MVRRKQRYNKKYIRRNQLGMYNANKLARIPARTMLSSVGYGNSNVYRFKRKYTDSFTLTYNGVATNTTKAWYFKLSDLPGYTEFTNLFDKYKLTGVRAQFLPRLNVMGHGDITGTFTEVPPIYSVVDYDDATAPTDFTTLEQYENCKIHWEFKPWKAYFKPMIAIGAYNGAFTGYGSSRKMWIDAASPDVQYYSLKVATGNYSAANNGNAPSWDVIFTYYIQCKYPR